MTDDTQAIVGRKGAVEVDRLVYRGNFCNLYDSQGRIVYTPALPGAPEDVYQEWTEIQRAAGSTHIPFGPPNGGPAYPGVGWDNPNFWDDLPALRVFIERLVSDGFVPVLFVGGDTFADSHWSDWGLLAKALTGLHDKLIVLAAWEPVIGGWTSAQVSQAWQRLHDLMPRAVLAGHGSPTRWVASSNPVEADDPWQGAEAESFRSHGGEHVAMWFYQLPHGEAIYHDCNEIFDDCWKNRLEDGVARLGAGFHGWRRMSVVLFETVAYEAFRTTGADAQRRMSAKARDIATWSKSIGDVWGVSLGYGNGLPW